MSISSTSLAFVESRRILILVLDRALEAREVFGSEDDTHPGIHFLFHTAKEFYVGGKLEALSRLEHYDFLDLRCKLCLACLTEKYTPPRTPR